jgi:catalase
MELNRMPENYFAEVEQAAFSPVNIVPGMGYSPDKMLQARLVSYDDAHRYRVGVNFDSLPVNRPKCPVNNYHRDGTTRFDDNGGVGPNYEPNSFGGPVEQHQYTERPMPISGDAARYNHRDGNDDYKQPGDLYRLMKPEERERLVHNIVASMRGIPERIIKLQIGHFTKADAEWGRRVAESLGVAEPVAVK